MQVKILEAENEIYQRQKLLGQGAFGKAYLVRHKQSGELLVIKQMNIEHMSKAERQETIKQAQILRNFHHPNIVRFVEVYATKQNKLKIVMEYAECGDLSKAITTRKNQKRFFEESQILDWFTQICLAMKHVHDRKILHRDIKGQNIFITKSNTLKLGDFGIARVLNKTHDKARTVVGTPYYLSPQIIENKPYSFKSDIWSMGVVLYELCALSPPFTATSLQFLALKIVKGSYPTIQGNYSKELKNLIGQILQIDPNKRPAVNQILKRPLIQDRIKKYLSQTCRASEFSHTVLHNHKVQISNNLVKMQQNKQNDKALQAQRLKLKQQERILLQKRLEKKKEEEKRAQQERLIRREQENKRKDEEARKKREDDLRREEEAARRKQEDKRKWDVIQKNKQEEMKRQWEENQRRRVQQIADLAKRKERQQNQIYQRKEALLRQKYQLEREKKEELEYKKKIQSKKQQEKKIDELNEFARKQFFENQMIRKRAEQRAKQSEQTMFTEQYPVQEPPRRPQSKNQGRNKQQQEPTEEEMQNAFVNPNFGKRNSTANAASNKKIDSTKQITPANQSKNRIPPSVNENKGKGKNYEEMREQIKRDREQYMREKEGQTQPKDHNVQTIKATKWQKKRSASKDRLPIQQPKQQSPKKPSKPSAPTTPTTTKGQESSVFTQDFKLNIKDQQEFNNYLEQLQGLLGNVNKNIENMQNQQKEEVFRDMPVEDEIVFRQDDDHELQYSLTGGFQQDKLQPTIMHSQDVDLDYFSNFSKLQTLRMNLENKFGTDNFIKIYRILEKELEVKGLQGFDIMGCMSSVDNDLVGLVQQSLPLLLTLIVMQEKMSAV